MNVLSYQSSNAADDLVHLLREKYESNKNFDYFLDDSKRSYSFCIDNENVSFYPVAGYENSAMRSHVALIIDKRLPAGEAFFGFLEFQEDAAEFSKLWAELVRTARDKGISTLKGPINGSIWHQYRCIKETDNSDFFKSELFCEPYYYDFLISCKPDVEVSYYSASRDPFDGVLRMVNDDSYKKLAAHGFSVKATSQVEPADLLAVENVSKTVFRDSWGYTELTEKEFIDLYSSEKLSDHLHALYLLYKGEEVIGFCGTLKEDDRTITCKTICVLPRYQGLGLGNALAYKVHADAKEQGFEKMIYALIREGNKIQNFPKDAAVIFRRYAAFEFRLK